MFSSFMINAWIVASIVAVVAGVVGFFVVIRGSSFAAHTLSLGAFPGAAAAHLLGVSELSGLIVFSGLGVVGIDQLGRRGRHEVATALCLSMLLGLGALFLSMTSEYAQEVYSLLFGEVLGVGGNEIAPIAIVGGVAIAATLILFRPLLLASFSPELAEVRGISSRRMDLLFLAVVALAAAAAVPIVGVLLVFSLMVGPAAAARLLAGRPSHALLLSAGVSLMTVWIAIALSYVTDWPIGFYVGVLGAASYLLSRTYAWARTIASAKLATN